MWTCPRCQRRFTRANQRHACGTGDRGEVVRGRPAALVELVDAIEKFARALGPIEVVTRDRYILLRSVRIFADLVIMKDAVRIAVHLGRKVDAPIFFKVAESPRQVSHVAKITSTEEWTAVAPFVKEAYRFSVSS
jgi:hypothetical protein